MSRWLVSLWIVMLATTSPARAEDAGSMCLEHGVLEVVCTRCHPRLAVVFRSKGDWCETHGFPASFCPTCKPLLGGRPEVDVTDDGAPADGLIVRLASAEVARAAGIETIRVEERRERPEVGALVRLVPDATRKARVNARAAGVVRSIRASVGTRVIEGQALAEIQSAGVGADRSRLEAARTRLDVAEAGRRRTRSLHQRGLAALKEVLAAEEEWANAKAGVDAASAALGMVDQAGVDGRTVLEAPIAGTVTRREISVGQLVEVSTPLFEIVDTSSIWALVDVPEVDIARVKEGQVVVLEIDTLPGREFTGRIAYLAPEVDRETRTVTARVALENSDGALRANMYGRARILVGDERSLVPVPRGALQRVRDVHLVFVRRGPATFVTRRVEVGAIDRTTARILSGLVAGEEVVIAGAFLLKTETLKGSIGAGCCSVE